MTTKKPRITDLAKEFISLTEASQISGLTSSFIRRLVSRGDIEGVKIGRNWVTTREAIQEYLNKERRPGPKPKREK